MPRLLPSWIAIAFCSMSLTAHAARERAVYAPPPDYPAEARARHLTGNGAFALHIRADGTVERIDTLKSIGHSLLDHAAIAAFQRWRFYRQNTARVLRIPIRYVDGPKRVDAAMKQTPAPGWGVLVTVFSGRNE
jgi:TonB family protein